VAILKNAAGVCALMRSALWGFLRESEVDAGSVVVLVEKSIGAAWRRVIILSPIIAFT
jgi:hypothetical protein